MIIKIRKKNSNMNNHYLQNLRIISVLSIQQTKTPAQSRTHKITKEWLPYSQIMRIHRRLRGTLQYPNPQRTGETTALP